MAATTHRGSASNSGFAAWAAVRAGPPSTSASATAPATPASGRTRRRWLRSSAMPMRLADRRELIVGRADEPPSSRRRTRRRPSVRLLAVAAVLVVRGDPLLCDDRRAERQLAAQHGRGDDLRELPHVALPVAPEQLEALLLRGEARPPAVGGDDERRDRDRVVVVTVLEHAREHRGGGGLGDVGDV